MAIEIIKDVFKVEEIKVMTDTQALIQGEIYLNTNKQEIDKVLWVEGRTQTLNAKLIKDRLILNGKVKFNVVYKNTEGDINTLEGVKDFKEEIVMEGVTEGMDSYIDSNIEYIEYTLEDNKIEVNALLNLSIKIEETKNMEVIKDIAYREGLQVLEDDIRYIEVYGRDTSYANIKDTVKVKDDNPAIEKVIRFSIDLVELQTVVTDDRMILSAEANVSMIYLGGDQVSYINESLPFNHFIEMPGIFKDSLGEVSLEVVDGIYEIVEDDSGELRLIDLEINIRVLGKVYDYKIRPLVVDVYSTKTRLNTQKEEINILENIENISHEEDLNLDIGIDALEVLDLKEEVIIMDKKILDDEIVIEGLVIVNIFYIDRTSGELRNFKEQFPYKSNIRYEGEYDGLVMDIKSKLDSTKYIAKKDMLSIDNIIKYNIKLNKEKTLYGIKSIEDSQVSIDTNNKPSIIVYIVQKGDMLWDIAKRYHTTIDDILVSNDLDSSYKINTGDKIIIEKNIDNDFEFI